MLLGVNNSSMDVLALSDGEFHIKFHIRNKTNNFIWSLLAVYGAVQDEDKEAFVRELVDLAKDNLHLILIGRFQFIKIQP
jgi:hypothetical protein